MAEQSRAKTLADKIRKAREFRLEVDGYVFILSRPSELDWYEKIIGSGSTARFLPFVVGWENVTEGDLIAGGTPHPLPFDAAVCAEWLSDRSDIYGQVIGALNNAFQKHTLERDDLKKT